MELVDLLPEDPKTYDKMRPPRKDDLPTAVNFHVTVIGIDSINEYSMVTRPFPIWPATWRSSAISPSRIGSRRRCNFVRFPQMMNHCFVNRTQSPGDGHRFQFYLEVYQPSH